MTYIDISSRISTLKNNREPIASDAIAVTNSINNIIATRKGSVPGHPSFGCNIERFVFEQMDPLTTAALKEELSLALSKWEPRINLSSINIEEDFDYNRINVKIKFYIKQDVDNSEIEYIYTLTK